VVGVDDRSELAAAGDPLRDVGMRLTYRTVRVLTAVAANPGASNREIAAQLFLSTRTVEYHLYKIFPKAGVSSRTELARLVLTQGLQHRLGRGQEAEQFGLGQ